jgi:hypothetical protein
MKSTKALIFCLASALLVSGCSDVDPVDEQAEQDTGWGIAYLTGHLLNTHVASRPAGRHDITLDCTNGGTVRIVGTTVYDNATALLHLDLTYDFSDAHAAVVATNIAVTFHPVTGAIRQTGALRLGSGDLYENHTAASTRLAFDVTVERVGRDAAALTGDGPYDVSVWSATNARSQYYRGMDGHIDGHHFAWSYPLTGTNGWTDTPGIHVHGFGDDDSPGDGVVADTQNAGWGLVYLTGYLFNRHLATRAVGTQNVAVACSDGGTIRMNGFTRYDAAAAVLSMDVTYAFANANASVSATNMTIRFSRFNGSIRQSGAVRIGSSQSWENHQSTGTRLVFTAVIRVPGASDRTLLVDGPYDASVRNTTNAVNQVYRSVDGSLNGRDFSWDYPVAGTNSAVITVNL